MNTLLQDFIAFWRYLERCCFQHPHDFNLDEIEEVLHWEQSVPDEEPGGAIVRMKDGKFAAFEESQDYTGHG